MNDLENNSTNQKPLPRRGWGRLYDHLFFDLDNTLWDFATNSKLAMKQTMAENELLSRLPSFDSYFDVYEKINHGLWDDYHKKQISKNELIVERFARSLGKFGITELDWKELNHRYLKNMALQTGLFPSTIDTLSVLRDKGYYMYIITNGFKEVQYQKLSNCGLDVFFRNMFVSEEIQTTKPSREIFEHALKSVNASKKKSIMIGDSWDTDIEGAMDFGIDQVMFTNNDSYPLPEEVNRKKNSSVLNFIELKQHNRTYFIKTLTELTAIL